jgi:hypothetical protein
MNYYFEKRMMMKQCINGSNERKRIINYTNNCPIGSLSYYHIDSLTH